jgi:phosphate transport system substrate-binding protein
MKRFFPSLLKKREEIPNKFCAAVTLGIWVMAFAQPALADKIIRYEGSATIGRYIDIARDNYQKAAVMMNVITESRGGEECLVAGRCDIGGIAGPVKPELIEKGFSATLIGRDAVAVIINEENPVKELTMEQVRQVFSGRITNWKEIGGPDHSIEVLITRPNSAIHDIFKQIVLKGEDYKGKIVDPYSGIVLLVSENKWAIGQVSLFFIDKAERVMPSRIDGQGPQFNNPRYPISRPLYLVTKGAPTGEVKDFIDWILSQEGQKLLKKFFVGAR